MKNLVFLVRGVTETIKNEAKEQKKKGFLGMLLGTLRNLLTGKGTIKQVKAQLEPERIFNAFSSLNKI